ncbi:serine/threonine-protein kinase bud32 [Elasticomyces elasticus]|nr:serine/threonine-protein kinase bud32 [Elasticomyces elasticus]
MSFTAIPTVSNSYELNDSNEVQPLHSLPLPFTTTSSPGQTPSTKLIRQGAEALLYYTHFLSPSLPCALKYRPPKSYRHPILDKRLTRARILAEARVLVRCKREGVSVPAVLGAGWEEGWIAIEWIQGSTVRDAIFGWKTWRQANQPSHEGGENDLVGLMHKIGCAVGKLHQVGVIHGDLTTSNLMLRPTVSGAEGGEEPSATSAATPFDGTITLIDFGLAAQSSQEEDRAVDLYVLERAFGSTHPEVEHLFPEVLKAYGDSYKGAKAVLKKLEDVRMRGRKKSMIG